jgi:hypothetical protein
MKPTKRQLLLLKFYAKYETKPLTFFSIVRLFWLYWLLLLIPIGFGYFFIWGGWPEVGWIFIGVSVGAFLRDINRIIALFRTWPVTHQVINWQRVKELLEAK